MKKGFKLHVKAILLLVVALVVWGVDHLYIKNSEVETKTIVSAQSSSNNEEPSFFDRFKKEENEFGFEKVYVKKVIDGDTFKLSDGRTVRMIGMNTPENTKTKELYGDVATDFVKAQIEGKYVYLEKQVSDKDKYDRLLRNVWIELPTSVNESEMRTKCLNSILILNGMAKSMSIEPNTTYSSLFKKFANEAKENKVGMWTLDKNGTTKGDF